MESRQKRQLVNASAGWFGLAIAVVTVVQIWLERDQARFEAQQAAATAAAHASVDIEDLINRKFLTVSTTIAVQLERIRWLEATVRDLREDLRANSRGRVYIAPAPNPAPVVVKPESPAPRSERVEEQKNQILKEAF